MGQRLHRMLAVFAINEEKLFVQCSECDGFVKLSDVEYTDYDDAVCASCHGEMMLAYWGPTMQASDARCSEDDSGPRGPYGDD